MIKLLSLFSGIGAFEKALERIGEPFETVNYCEIDKYAAKAYSLIHNTEESKNLKDVTKINTDLLPDDLDLITYGFPCQDISLAGKQKGFKNEDGSLTRSGLFFEALRIIEATKPKFAIAENVKALTDKTFETEFQIVLDSLEDAGYKNYYAVLNAKDYGIPQNRERVFIISIRDDIDHGFQFPAKYKLKLRLKNLLEETVDEKYFLSDTAIQGFLKHNLNHKAKGTGFLWKPKDGNGDDIANCLRANGALCATDNCIDETQADYLIIGGMQKHQSIKTDGICTTLTASMGTGGGYVPMITERQMTIDDFLPVKEATKKGYKEAHDGDYVNLQYPNSETRRGRVGDQCANTLLCNDANGVVISDDPNHNLKPKLESDKTGQYIMPNLRIRKLTPKECFRLMGFDDKDCDILVANKISNAQMYKMAGNSIVVDVLEYLFKALFMQYGDQLQIAAEIEPIELEPMILDFRQITFDDLLEG